MSQANDYSNPRCAHARRGLIIRASKIPEVRELSQLPRLHSPLNEHSPSSIML